MRREGPTGALTSLRLTETKRQDQQGGDRDQQAQVEQGTIPNETIDAGFIQKTPRDERDKQCRDQTDQGRSDEHAEHVDFAQRHHRAGSSIRPGQCSSSLAPISDAKATMRSRWSAVRSSCSASRVKAERAFRPFAPNIARIWRPRSASSRLSAKTSKPANNSVWPPRAALTSSPTWVTRSNIRASQRSVSGRKKSGARTVARKPLAIRRLARRHRVDGDAGGGSAENAITAMPRPRRAATTSFSVVSN